MLFVSSSRAFYAISVFFCQILQDGSLRRVFEVEKIFKEVILVC